MKQKEGKSRNIKPLTIQLAKPYFSRPHLGLLHRSEMDTGPVHRLWCLSTSPALYSVLEKSLHATDILQNWYLRVFKRKYYLNWFA